MRHRPALSCRRLLPAANLLGRRAAGLRIKLSGAVLVDFPQPLIKFRRWFGCQLLFVGHRFERADSFALLASITDARRRPVIASDFTDHRVEGLCISIVKSCKSASPARCRRRFA